MATTITTTTTTTTTIITTTTLTIITTTTTTTTTTDRCETKETRPGGGLLMKLRATSTPLRHASTWTTYTQVTP